MSRLAAAAVLLALAAGPSAAQTQDEARTFDELRARLKPGETIWVTDAALKETRGRSPAFSLRQ